ncbi:unnamed protein product [Sphagnum troendelagicum]
MAKSMMRSLRHTFVAAPSKVAEEATFQVDWSAISPSGLGLVFKELLADLIGAPPLPEVLRERELYKRSWNRTDISSIYLQRHLVGPIETGFLVRGVIFDMPSLIQWWPQERRQSSTPTVSSASSSSSTSGKVDLVERMDVKRRDWASLLDINTTVEAKDDAKAVQHAVSANEIIESLGLKTVVPGLQDRIGAIPVRKQKLKSRMEERQALEEIMGRGDSIRAKYADKIYQKKMLAEARREQEKLGIVPTANPSSPGASARGWQAMPGAPALVRYIEERGLPQALLAWGKKEDLNLLLDQLGNFHFGQIRHVRQGTDASSQGEPISNEVLKRICIDWGLSSKQVMVVIGGGQQSEATLRAVGDSGFFVCRVNNRSIEEEKAGNKDSFIRGVDLENKGSQYQKGLVSWFSRLAEGTLHVDEHSKAGVHISQGDVHFSISDMVELKWVIEDLNGISYRKSTLVTGFQEANQGVKQ